MTRNIDSAIESMRNMIRETEFEGEFISLNMKTDRNGELVIETKTVAPKKLFTILFNRKEEIVHRRFRKDLGVVGSPIIVEVRDGGAREWVPEKETCNYMTFRIALNN